MALARHDCSWKPRPVVGCDYDGGGGGKTVRVRSGSGRFAPAAMYPELLHPAAEGVRVELEHSSRSFEPLDHPAGLVEDRQDVIPLDLFHRGELGGSRCHRFDVRTTVIRSAR